MNNVGQALAEQLELDALIERARRPAPGGLRRRPRVRRAARHRDRHDRVRLLQRGRAATREPADAVRRGTHLQDPPDARADAPEPGGRRSRRSASRWSGRPPKSYLGVPIVAGTDAIGVISVQSTEQAGRFGEADSRLLTTIAANVGDRDPERPPLPGDPTPGERDGGARPARTGGGRTARARPDPRPDGGASARAARRRHERGVPRRDRRGAIRPGGRARGAGRVDPARRDPRRAKGSSEISRSAARPRS